MPVDMSFDTEHGVLIRTVHDPVAMPDVLQAMRSQIQHPDYRRGMSILWDLRDAKLETLTSEMMSEMSDEISGILEQRGNGGFATVTTMESTMAIMNTYKVRIDHLGFPVRNFNDFDEALVWCVETSSFE